MYLTVEVRHVVASETYICCIEVAHGPWNQVVAEPVGSSSKLEGDVRFAVERPTLRPDHVTLRDANRRQKFFRLEITHESAALLWALQAIGLIRQTRAP